MAGSGRDLQRCGRTWRRGRRKRGPTGRAHMAATRERERASQAECANQRRKRNPVSAPRVLGLSGPSEGAAAYDGRAGRRR
jgi:hypothetical protein